MENTVFKGYKVGGLIAEGGMSKIYAAQHPTLVHRKIAIKFLKPELVVNEQVRQRFINEAQTMSLLNHPQIVSVFELFEEDGKIGIVMELLSGVDLKNYVEKYGRLNEQEVVNVFSLVLQAFEYAHSKGIVHRDVKPSNIFRLDDGSIKILDFGIAKILDEEFDLTKTGTQMGTPMYMSPEQVKDSKSIDFRSDIYSLGVSLYYLCTGTPPYDKTLSSNFDIMNSIVNKPLTKTPLISSELFAVIEKATQKAPDLRYQNCNEFLYSLTQISSSDPKGNDSTQVIVPESKGFDNNNNSTHSNNVNQPQNQNTNKPPTNYLVISILVTIFCCWPLGIPAIVNATRVNSRFYAGDIEGAYKASKQAKTYTIISAILGLVFSIIYILVAVFEGGYY